MSLSQALYMCYIYPPFEKPDTVQQIVHSFLQWLRASIECFNRCRQRVQILFKATERGRAFASHAGDRGSITDRDRPET